MLPVEYAALLGYTDDTLKSVQAEQAQGYMDVHEAVEPCIAWIPGAEWATFTFTPTFLPATFNTMWGRQDFLHNFPVAFYEARKEFVLTLPDQE